MPGVDTGRQKVSAYLKEHKISYPMLAVSYGMNKQDVSDYLSGRKDTPKSRQFIIQLIRDLGIKYEDGDEK